MEYTDRWPRRPEAARLIDDIFVEFTKTNRVVADLADRFRERAGVDFRNLIDHWILPSRSPYIPKVQAAGYSESITVDGDLVWVAEGSRLPRVRIVRGASHASPAIAVDDVTQFLSVNGLTATNTSGDKDSSFESACVALPHGELIVLARRGYDGFRPGVSAHGSDAIIVARREFSDRPRSGIEKEVIAAAAELFDCHAAAIGAARAVDEFFAAERCFYTGRNLAAQWILRQQTQLGFGWANHDHHTYRSSRESFIDLTNLWSLMGFVPRERFYAGDEAGWGAQVLDHPVSRVVIFADVDMAPDEVDVDFSHTRLQTRQSLGTIGLWCALHTSSIAEAGMHHLECEFDFEAASRIFASKGFRLMPPFTDLPILKQRFTEAEKWRVPEDRLQQLIAQRAITPEQAAVFRETGAPGSHVEILQRREGFKGFNKTGVSSTIRSTDARLAGPPTPNAGGAGTRLVQ